MELAFFWTDKAHKSDFESHCVKVSFSRLILCVRQCSSPMLILTKAFGTNVFDLMEENGKLLASRTTTTTTTATTTTPRLVARCSVVPAPALVASLFHSLSITIIYYYNRKCSARTWQPASLEQSSPTPHPPNKPHITSSHISCSTCRILNPIQPLLPTPLNYSIVRADEGRATSPR
jgi:hypothetical protein